MIGILSRRYTPATIIVEACNKAEIGVAAIMDEPNQP